MRSLTCLFLIKLAVLLLLVDHGFAKRSQALSSGLQRDKSGLLALANALSDTGRSKVGAWKARGNPCFPKPWPHITCSAGRVNTIDLANLDIVGTLPVQLKRVNKLTDLNLENNMFAGAMPDAWADRKSMRSLKSINLANNLLSGALPNRKWNAKGAFQSLEVLTLSGNQITGGLPDGWLSTANVFRKLKLLDLSDNKLGYAADGTALTKAQWCPEGRTVDSGWCPSTVNKGRAPTLEILDLSENDLAGALPTNWPQMFPNLQFLLIQRNALFSTTDVPAALPTAWTQRTVPRAFPQLQSLVLYPGNDNICSLPTADGGFSDINTVNTYTVESDDETEYDSDNPWFCQGAISNNPPTEVAFGAPAWAAFMRVTWTAPADADSQDMDKIVYAYRVSICEIDPDTTECQPTAGYTGLVLPTSTATTDGGGDFDRSTEEGLVIDDYTLITTIPKTTTVQYRVVVSSLNMDGIESTGPSAVNTLIP